MMMMSSMSSIYRGSSLWSPNKRSNSIILRLISFFSEIFAHPTHRRPNSPINLQPLVAVPRDQPPRLLRVSSSTTFLVFMLFRTIVQFCRVAEHQEVLVLLLLSSAMLTAVPVPVVTLQNFQFFFIYSILFLKWLIDRYLIQKKSIPLTSNSKSSSVK